MKPSDEDAVLGALTSWLTAGAPPPRSFDDFMADYAKRLIHAGLPIASLAFYAKHIHPMFPGHEVLWTEKRGIRHGTYTHEHLAGMGYHETPFGQAIESGRVQRHVIAGGTKPGEPAMIQIYRKAGLTDLLVLPLFDVDGVVNMCIGYSTKADGGFSEDQIRLLRRLQAPLARICQHHSAKSDLAVSLGTYVGRATAQKILEGEFPRGEGETISAVICFVDFIGFTEQSNRLAGEEVVRRLNAFFDVIAASMAAHGGEILKFLGDGALVIFSVPDDLTAHEAVAQGALDAIREARKRLSGSGEAATIDFRASLHVGDIFYGNVGSRDRLDFTAIGPAVNLASRILGEAGQIGAKTVCSDRFHEISGLGPCTPEVVELKGFNDPVPIFIIET